MEAARFNSATDGWSATPRTPLSISPRRSAHRELTFPQHPNSGSHGHGTFLGSCGQPMGPNLDYTAISFHPAGESGASNRSTVSFDPARKLRASGRFAISFHPA